MRNGWAGTERGMWTGGEKGVYHGLAVVYRRVEGAGGQPVGSSGELFDQWFRPYLFLMEMGNKEEGASHCTAGL